MFSIDDFFKIFQFYNDNKNTIGLTDSETQPDLVFTDETNDIDDSIIQIAVDTKLQALNFFKAAIDTPAFNSSDYNKFRRLILDWYATNKTFADIQRASSDPQTLDPNLLEIALRSFGFDYGSLILQKSIRAQFLLAIANLYKIKGSPVSITEMLKFFGFDNIRIYEWWLVRKGADDIYFEGRKIDTGGTVLEEAFPDKRLLTFENFLELDDPHWFYTRDQILNLDTDPVKGLIGLPSITPYFSIATVADLRGITRSYIILSRMFKDQYDNFINNNPPPKDLFIDVANTNTSLIALYLGILYSYWNYNDFLQYIKLRDYIIEEFEIVPELDSPVPFVYQEPNAYQRLLYWTISRQDENNLPDPLDITASSKVINFPNQVSTHDDLPDSNNNEGDTILVKIGLSGFPEIYRWDGSTWNLLDILAEGLGVSKQPKSGTPFVLYPETVEVYSDEVDVSNGIDDDFLDYDVSIINYDEKVFYPLLNNFPKLQPDCSYLYLTDPDFTNYNQPFPDLPQLSNDSEAAIEDFFETTSRPTDYDDAKDKLDQFYEKFTRLQSLNFIQNKQDAGRLLNDIDPAFKQYIDDTIGENRLGYLDLIEDLILELDTFASTVIGRTPIDLKQLLLGIPNIGEDLLPVIDLFKPKRARFLSYELIHQINDPSQDSINLKSEIAEMTIQMNVPSYGGDTLRGDFPQNYDVYPLGHDSRQIHDDISIEVQFFDGSTVSSTEYGLGPDRLDEVNAHTGDDLSTKNDLLPLTDDEETTYIPQVGDRVSSNFDNKIYVVESSGFNWTIASDGNLVSGDVFRVESNLTLTPGSAEIDSVYHYNGSVLQLII